MKKKICIVGGGTAGWIAASYIIKTCSNIVDVTIIYDHDNPVIGVGESTTPNMLSYLDVVDVSYIDLIKEIGTTLKFGIKFTNWNGDDKRYYHTFNIPDGPPFQIADRNFIAAYEIANNLDTGAETYASSACDNHLIPIGKSGECLGNFALHIDGVKFSDYIKKKFQDKVTVVDDIIDEVNIQDGSIFYLTGKKSGKIEADIYIDASGLQSILMSKLNNTYVSKKDYVVTDSAIVCQIPYEGMIPPYTEAIATKDGWIWQVPLQKRFGTGYVYSSKFTSDDEAKKNFEEHINKTFGGEHKVTRDPIRYNPGYWAEQWKGNCVTIGLSSGFVEPLEATAIHMIINQIRFFIGCWETIETTWSRKRYNNFISDMYEQTFDFIRLHYNTKRNDSPIWQHYQNNKPQWLVEYSEKCKKSIITTFDVFYDWDRVLASKIFGLTAFTRVSYGLDMFDSTAAQNWINTHGYQELSKQLFDNIEDIKNSVDYVKHSDYLNFITQNK